MSADAGSSVLVLERPFDGAGTGTCITTYADGSTDLLSVLYTERVADRVDRIERHAESTASAAIIAVGPTVGDGDSYGEHDAVRALSDPADLTGTGMAITEWLERRDDPASASYGLLSVIPGSTARLRAVAPVHSDNNPYQSVSTRCRRCSSTPSAIGR